MLTSLSLFGEAHAIDLTLNGEDQKRLSILNKSLSEPRYASNKSTHLSQAKFQKKGREEIESTMQRLFWPAWRSSFFFPNSPRMGFTTMFSHSLFRWQRWRSWLQRPLTWVLCMSDLMSVRAISSSQPVNITLSPMLMRLSSRCPSRRDSRLYPQASRVQRCCRGSL